MTEQNANDLDGFDFDKSLTVRQAAKLLKGRGGRSAHLESVRRWISKGCRPGGEGAPLLKLKAVWSAGQWLTCVEWIREFQVEMAREGARRRDRPQPPPLGLPERSRRAAFKRSQRILASMGMPTGEVPDPKDAKKTG